MHIYRQVILHMRQGESDRAIARSGLLGRTKTKRVRTIALAQNWLDNTAGLPDDTTLSQFFDQHLPRRTTESLALPYNDEITLWVQQDIQATTIHQALVHKYNYRGGYDSVQRFVQKIKTSITQKSRCSTILTFAPGEAAQVDFGQGPEITDVQTGEVFKTWIFVMVLAWSRHMYAEIVTNQKVETWLGCHRRAFEFFNGVPRRIIIDNPKCAITKACYHDPQVQRSYGEFAQGYGFMISACPPREPKKKGIVESGVKYVKKNFVPLREYRSIVDSNKQLIQWILEIAGNRIHGTTHEKPLNRFHDTEKFLLQPLPERPIELSVWTQVTLHGDCHVQFEKCRYSAPYKLVGKILWLRASETTTRIYEDYKLVATHPRLTKPGSHHTIDEHIPPNALAYKMRDPQWCLTQARTIGQCCHQIINTLFADKVLDQLRAAQGIVALQNKYGENRLEAACRRAIAFETINYHSIKNILIAGVEYESLPQEDAFDYLAQSYTGGGQYSRDTKQLIQ